MYNMSTPIYSQHQKQKCADIMVLELRSPVTGQFSEAQRIAAVIPAAVTPATVTPDAVTWGAVIAAAVTPAAVIPLL